MFRGIFTLVRVTEQLCQPTAIGVVSEEDMRVCAEQLDLVYHDASCIGSLVVLASNDPDRSVDWKPA